MVKKIGFALALGLSSIVACGDAELAIQEAYDDCIWRLGGSTVDPPANAITPECVKASDCAIQPDPRCGTVECVDGKCEAEIRIGALPSQVRGDCHRLDCDVKGKVLDLDDPSDFYNDGKQCTMNYCDKGQALTVNFGDGATCPETGFGVCFEGECVDCIDSISPSCPGGLACHFTICAPMHCNNSQVEKALGETDLDCGGPCSPCAVGYTCKVDSDCIQGLCLGGLCKAPSCTDGVKNDGETGIDCGGTQSCPRCPTGQGCELPSDCESGVCWAGLCQAPQCDDGIANGNEQSVDCGGLCPACNIQK